MQRYRAYAIGLALTGLVTVSGVVAGQMPPSNVTRHTANADVVPQDGPLEVYQLIIDFVPGAASSVHYHSGTSQTTVLAGAITVRYADSERQVGVGESWTDAPGVVHQAVNRGSTPAVVVAVFVQPKGALVTVPVASLQTLGPVLPQALLTTENSSCDDILSACP